MLDRISWVRWILYIVALFLPIFIIYTIMKPADKIIDLWVFIVL